MSEVSRYTAAIPPLSTIRDPDTRRVVEALVNGWRMRNGETRPDSDQRFITKGELSSLVGRINSDYFGPGGPGQSLIAGTGTGGVWDNPEIIRQLQDAVMRTRLWQDLGERIRRVDLSLVQEQQQRIAAVQGVADDLAEEAATRLGFDTVQGSAINSLQSVTQDSATKIEGLTTRLNGAESTIVSLQQTTATQATSLTQLSTRVGASESRITELDTTTATQAQSLTSLTTRVGTTESNVSVLQTTTADQASQLTSLSTRTASTEAAITAEATTRANADTAIVQDVDTQFSRVNDSLAAVQAQTNTLSTSVSSVSQQVTTLQSTVGDFSTALEIEARARADADGALYSQYTVKIDQNGYVSGYGLASSATDAAPTSDFIVRADRFSVGSPAGPGISPVVPFIVLTTNQNINGQLRPPGVYIEDAVIANGAITRAMIGAAAVDELTIAGNAVTQAVTGSFGGASYPGQNIPVNVGSLTVDVGTAPANGGSLGVLIMFTYEHTQVSGGIQTLVYGLRRDGEGYFFAGTTNHPNNSPNTTVTSFAFDAVGGGVHTYSLDVMEYGDILSPGYVSSVRMFVLGTKR